MRRVSVQGVPGSGKSTFGRALAARLGAPYTELDALYWGPDWRAAAADDFAARVAALVAADCWVIDGRYHGALGDLVVARADTVVWLDYPVRIWLSRLVRRTIRRMVLREELWSGNRERLRNVLLERPSLFEWAWRKHHADRTFVPRWVGAHPDVRLVRLRNPRAARRFLAEIEQNRAHEPAQGLR